MITDLESPLNSLWRIVRSGFCLFKASLEKIGFSNGVIANITNVTEYDNLLSEYSKDLNRSDVTFNYVPNSFYFTIPKLYKSNILPLFSTSVSNYLSLITDLQKLKFYTSNIDNLAFNWTDPIYNSNEIISNLNLANFTSTDVANVASKLNLSVFQGYKVILNFHLK